MAPIRIPSEGLREGEISGGFLGNVGLRDSVERQGIFRGPRWERGGLWEHYRGIIEEIGGSPHRCPEVTMRPSPNVRQHAFALVAYHLSRSALMLVQAAGTGASAGAAGVSESDMSVLMGGVVAACPVL